MQLYFNEDIKPGIEREFPKSLIGWYEFNSSSKALFVSGGLPEGDVLFEVMHEKGIDTRCISLCQLDNDEIKNTDADNSYKFDYIVGFGILEKSQDSEQLLRKLKELLSDHGRMLLGMDNRLGMRYFCGDKDAFTGNCFDGIDKYFYSDIQTDRYFGHAYSMAEIIKMLDHVGLLNRRFYSVMPVLENPRLLFAEDYLPEEELDTRVDPQYRSPETVFLDEKRIYRTLVDNGLFHVLANGYLLEISPDGKLSDVLAVTSSLDRGRKHAVYTTITRNNIVTKRPAYPEGKSEVAQIFENSEYLNRRGIKTILGHLNNDVYEMPYVNAPTGTEYFRNLFGTDRDKFLSELDRFMDLIDTSSEIADADDIDWEKFDPDWKDSKTDDPGRFKWRDMAYGIDDERNELGPIFKRGYIDLVCLNCFVIDDEFYFFDQEFVMDNLPAKAIKSRTIHLIYDADMEKDYPMENVLARYGLLRNRDFWVRFEGRFLDSLRNHGALAAYIKTTQVQGQTAALNRNRINYTEAEYDRLFKDIFSDIGGKKLFIFGSGRFTERFLSRYQEYIDVSAIIDNDRAKHGEEKNGIKIVSPEILSDMSADKCKVFICIKSYENVLNQLKELGIKNISIFNPDANYPRPLRIEKTIDYCEGKIDGEKKYKVGYISGVFDLFHIGHVNLFRKAKEMCNYLIVGVATDEQVMNSKKTMPHIPYEQRKAVVEACRYVDEAVMIPPEDPGSEEAYKRYHFDAQFCGSDYADDPYWLGAREWLRERGSDLVFFPYTEETSTTQIKKRILEDHQ